MNNTTKALRPKLDDTEPAAAAAARLIDTVDLLVIGAGTGMAAALTASELGMSSLVVEKSEFMGGSTARSGGAFWIPANSVLQESGANDSLERAEAYLRAVVEGEVPDERWLPFLTHGGALVELLRRGTTLKFAWAKGYSDYHPELPGGSANGRTCEPRPFDLSVLGEHRKYLRPAGLAPPVPMPVMGADYRWMNLMVKVPGQGLPRIFKRLAIGVGGMAIKREYVAGGQALAAGLFAGLISAGVPYWTETSLVRLTFDGDRVTGAVFDRKGEEVTVKARRGVVLSAGGFDHNMMLRQEYQSHSLQEDLSMGAPSNTGDAIEIAKDIGADLAFMDQAWWFPAVAPMPEQTPPVLLAERALPGSFMVDCTGRRFTNEASDYMSFGQAVLAKERAGEPVGQMWLVFDQEYRNSYVFAGGVFPRRALPQAWYDANICQRGATPRVLAREMGVPETAFEESFQRFNQLADAGIDEDFHRGSSAYDRYYGDPTIAPNPNLRSLHGNLYAVRVVLSDLGTCGGLVADGYARVIKTNGTPIPGLYVVGNCAGNAFGKTYPGAGATLGQGMVFSYIAARHAAGKPV